MYTNIYNIITTFITYKSLEFIKKILHLSRFVKHKHKNFQNEYQVQWGKETNIKLGQYLCDHLIILCVWYTKCFLVVEHCLNIYWQHIKLTIILKRKIFVFIYA